MVLGCPVEVGLPIQAQRADTEVRAPVARGVDPGRGCFLIQTQWRQVGKPIPRLAQRSGFRSRVWWTQTAVGFLIQTQRRQVGKPIPRADTEVRESHRPPHRGVLRSLAVRFEELPVRGTAPGPRNPCLPKLLRLRIDKFPSCEQVMNLCTGVKSPVFIALVQVTFNPPASIVQSKNGKNHHHASVEVHALA
jgi:hypothetical protein